MEPIVKKEKVLYWELNWILIYSEKHWKSPRFGPSDQGEVAPLQPVEENQCCLLFF